MDPWSWLQLVTASAMANVIVVGLAGASIVMLGGAFYLVVNFDVAKRHVLNGLLLTVVLGLLAMAQLRMVPRSFSHVGELGLLAVPAGAATALLDGITGTLHLAVTWVGGALVPMGLLLTLARVNWGPKMVIVGAVMSVLAAIATGDGLVMLALRFMGTIA